MVLASFTEEIPVGLTREELWIGIFGGGGLSVECGLVVGGFGAESQHAFLVGVVHVLSFVFLRIAEIAAINQKLGHFLVLLFRLHFTFLYAHPLSPQTQPIGLLFQELAQPILGRLKTQPHRLLAGEFSQHGVAWDVFRQYLEQCAHH